VTGAAKRLGATIAKKLAMRGHSVVIQYHKSQQDAESLAHEIANLGFTAELLQGNFSSIESTQDFIARYKKRYNLTKFLVNNVGNYEVIPTSQTPPEMCLELFQSNVHAPLLLCQELLPSIRKLQGSIVNIGTSGLHDGRAKIETGVYMATKAALWSLTKSLAKEFAKERVTVNMVSPGQLENSVSLPSLASLPMGRAGTTEEVAEVVAFLFSEENHYITAQNIEVAGALGL
jgi:NAD(P)-dependent dehydrogenase (short-subunit alcohol dehydrogenase family)